MPIRMEKAMLDGGSRGTGAIELVEPGTASLGPLAVGLMSGWNVPAGANGWLGGVLAG